MWLGRGGCDLGGVGVAWENREPPNIGMDHFRDGVLPLEYSGFVVK